MARMKNGKHTGIKQNLTTDINTIKESVKEFNFIYLMKVEGRRSAFLRLFRNNWYSKGRIFFHENTTLSMFLGLVKSEEIEDNLSGSCIGESCIFLTNEPVETVREHFKTFTYMDYARKNNIAAETLTIPVGIVLENDGQPVSINKKNLLKRMGLPIKVKNDSIWLLEDYTICKIGDRLSKNQVYLLRLLGYKIATFKPITRYYDKERGETFIL